ncbi:MAG: Rpn family recombination-promoting nuclease/putative transposase [Treponema sp.]|jgi:predicted transposase/invertase (TIGR01784 family)|nr:Rpn family recombination-promoting nuclease/putative transposase [Treponema sp.]
MTKLEYTFKTDTLFKMLFVQYPDLLKHLVSALLVIPLESIEQFEITNSEMPPDNLGDKFCCLDINMIVNSQRVNLEIQVRNEKYYPERVLYHWAREYSASLPEGGRYQSLPRTVVISIIDFNQFDAPDFHSEFCPLEVRRHERLSDKMSLHFFELPKLPKAPLNANDKLLLWLSLFKAETEEELAQIKDLEVPIMEQAINAYQKITVTPEFREKERLRSIARHNEASALSEAEEKGIEKGIVEGREKEREKWQGVVVGKDAEIENQAVEITNQAAEIEKLRLQLAELQAKVRNH